MKKGLILCRHLNISGRVFLFDASSGLRCPNCGGNADNGDNDGVGYVNVNNAFSDANANVSSPHYLSAWSCLQPSEKIMEKIRAPVRKIKHHESVSRSNRSIRKFR